MVDNLVAAGFVESNSAWVGGGDVDFSHDHAFVVHPVVRDAKQPLPQLLTAVLLVDVDPADASGGHLHVTIASQFREDDSTQIIVVSGDCHQGVFVLASEEEFVPIPLFQVVGCDVLLDLLAAPGRSQRFTPPLQMLMKVALKPVADDRLVAGLEIVKEIACHGWVGFLCGLWGVDTFVWGGQLGGYYESPMC